MMPYIDSEVLKMAYSSVKGKEKIGFVKVATMFIAQASIGMDIETAKKFASTLKKYPQEYALLKIAVQTIIEQLKQLIAD
jgi:hypothetical protein